MKTKNSEPVITFDHINDDLNGLNSHYISIEKEKKALSTWYVVYEEVIILSLMVALVVTTI